MEPEQVRIDKWLWAVRVFKTRSQAGAACKAGKIKIKGISVKPSREIRPGEEITVSQSGITRTIRVKALLHNRVSAKLAVDFVEDLTPPEEIEKLKAIREVNYEYRKRGLGRPTKKQRRIIDKLKKYKDF